MNALIIYDSQFGNTERIALAIADALRRLGHAEAMRVDATRPVELHGIDLLILGSPTQGWRPMPSMQALIAQIASSEATRGMAFATFDTRFHKPGWLTGSAAKRMAAKMRHGGATPLAQPESFFVAGTQGPLEEGEEARATQWALTLRQRYEATHPQYATR